MTGRDATLFLAIVVGAAAGLFTGLVAFAFWRLRHTRAVRADAVARSRAVTTGMVTEQLVPYFPRFPFAPQDVRFLGSPVDLVVFDGATEGDVRRVVFVEVKTAGSELSARQRRVRDAVRAGRVEWLELRVDSRD